MQIWRLLFQTIFHFWNLFCYHHFNLSSTIRNLFPSSWAHLLLKNRIVYRFSIFSHSRPKPAAGFALPLILPFLPDSNPAVWDLGKCSSFLFLLCGLLGDVSRGVNGTRVSSPACNACATRSSCSGASSWVSGANLVHAWRSTYHSNSVLVLARFIRFTFLASSVQCRMPLLNAVSGCVLVFKTRWS